MENEKQAIREAIQNYTDSYDKEPQDLHELVDWIWDVVANYID